MAEFEGFEGDFIVPFTLKTQSAAFGVNEDFVQYEWIENEHKWVTFFDHDPDPPDDLPPGKYDGQIIDVKLDADKRSDS